LRGRSVPLPSKCGSDALCPGGGIACRGLMMMGREGSSSLELGRSRVEDASRCAVRVAYLHLLSGKQYDSEAKGRCAYS